MGTKAPSSPRRALVGAVLAATVAAIAPAPAGAASPPARGYVVVYRDGVADVDRATDRREHRLGFRSRLRYRGGALKGFSARLGPGEAAALRRDPDVEMVGLDRPVRASGAVPLATGETAPPGIRRIGAATATTSRPASGASVAVIDTGIDLSHPDLDAVGGRNCTGSGAAQDGHGHGTHVAGTIGARNTGTGVVGVAPGTRLHAVKVLNSSGEGTISQVICGIDWVAANRQSLGIAVANLSLGGPGTSDTNCGRTNDDALHRAVCNAVAAGVTLVVAAGNEARDLAGSTPAAYPEALTVTAMTDTDGRPGGAGLAPTCRPSERDDRYASFSNFATAAAARAHTIAAPGTCIRSTWTLGRHHTISGTSMASPHVAGAVALCLVEGGAPGPCAGMAPGEVVAHMRSVAGGLATSANGFLGDPLRPVSTRYFGHLVATPAEPDRTAPTVAATDPGDGATGVSASRSVAVTFSEAMDQATAQAAFSLLRTSDQAPVAGSFSWSGTTMTFRPTSPLQGDVGYTARLGTGARDLAGNALGAERAWGFRTAATTFVSLAPAAAVLQAGTLRTGSTVARLAADDGLLYEVNATGLTSRTASWYGSFRNVPAGPSSLAIAYRGLASAPCAQVISVYRWSDRTWQPLDSRTASTAETEVAGLVPAGAPGAYVGAGELRVQVRCTSSGSALGTSLVLGTDQLQLTYGT